MASKNTEEKEVITNESDVKESEKEVTVEKEIDPNEKVLVNLRLDEKHMDDVFVSVNGTTFQIQRGKDVEVPYYVALVLKQSEKMDQIALERQLKLANKQ